VERAKPSDRIGSASAPESSSRSRDADVEPAGTHVDRDVPRAEVEELDLVDRVDEDEFLRLLALPVAGLMEHRRRRLCE
jgi:hypothetical protein